MKIRILNLRSATSEFGPKLILILLIFALASTIFLGVPMYTSSVAGSNVTNQTVVARVNVSNTEPDLYKVVIDHPLDSNDNIDLTASAVTTVVCNGSFMDINGFNDIVSVNATLFLDSIGSDAPDDNNNHYTNSSCLEGEQDCTPVTGETNNGSCICQFAVQYYANAGNWRCNMTINDSGGITDNENSALTNLNEILGISVETSTIDFGNLSVTQTSDPIRENVTNGGNIDINVTVRGYGGSNESIGQNVSMICDPASGALANITFDNMRFDTKNDTAYANMFNITNQTKQIFNLTIPQRIADAGYGNSSNSTFWRLQIPLGAGGVCNGTIIFGGMQASLD